MIDKKRLERLTKIAVFNKRDLFHDLKKTDGEHPLLSAPSLTNVSPLFHPSNITCSPREDIITNGGLSPTEALKNAVIKKKHYFIAIRTITK